MEDHKLLEEKARELRKKVLDIIAEMGEGHPAGCFSEIEILVSLYERILKQEDKFILSKGHACPPFYAILREKGHNPKLAGHPEIDIKNGINCTTGSLGHGLPMAVGMAFARKLKNQPGRIYVLLGDGECQEGTTWESSLIASRCSLDNLTVIVDKNNLQALDMVDNILPLGNLSEKFKSLGFDVSEVNGHSFQELLPALEKRSDKPRMIIANTVKGKCISFMENDPKWHGRFLSPEEFKQAYGELGYKQ